MMEQNSESGTIPESQPLPLIDVMYSIADSQGLDGAVDYESGMQDGQIMRCDSDSGKKLIKSMVLRTADRQGMC